MKVESVKGHSLLGQCVAATMLLPLGLYRLTLSHIMPPCCRFQPSCSAYAWEAIRRHGPWKGGWLTAKRLARCQPWGPCGDDPVPD